jgi:hypothetical protein
VFRISLFIGISALFGASALLAQQTAATAWQPPFTIEVVDLPRASNGVEYRLYVRRPLLPLGAGETSMAVYVLDALWALPSVAALHSNIEQLRRLPPTDGRRGSRGRLCARVCYRYQGAPRVDVAAALAGFK